LLEENIGMALSSEERDFVAAFREYVEDTATKDERYGPVSRTDSADGSVVRSRFALIDTAWIEADVRTVIPEVRVGFGTTDPAIRDGIMEMLGESGVTLEQIVGTGFADAGLDWPNPVVDTAVNHGESTFATPLPLEELHDLNSDEIRDKTLRMLEGYMIAFGAAFPPEDDDEFEDKEDDEEDE